MRRPFSRWAILPILFVALSASAQEAREPVRYVLRFPDAQQHYVDVEVSYPAGDVERVELMMAVWTPGSYLVREFSRHVEEVQAFAPSGEPLPVEKTRKNRWTVQATGRPRVDLRYRVYGREMTVRTNWIEADFAILNGAPTFLTLAGDHARPHEIALVLPREWRESWTGMPAHPDGRPHHYLAADFDELVDSPIYLGTPAVYSFEVAGKPHYLVNHGEDGVWDGKRSARDVQAIVQEALRFWGDLPYERYVFLNMITEGRGGLEHKTSTLLMTSRWRSRDPDGYRRWLGLVSHEYFHAWNVKRLRPLELGPFDYEREAYSKSLWIAEGVTSYYDDLLLARAGILTDKQYLKALSRRIESLQTTPGRKVRPLELSSFDSWIRQYRPDENSANTTISYYTKGAVVAFLLDAEIRRATDGEQSLDDVMRTAYELYSGETGYTPEEFRAVAAEIAGRDLSAFFQKTLESTEELDYGEALEWFGLVFDEKKRCGSRGSNAEGRGCEAEAKGRAWLGAHVGDDDGRLVVKRVPRETPAYEHGVNVGDEILAVDDFRVTHADWKERLATYGPGDRVELLVARRERLLRLPIELGEAPPKRWRLEVDPDARYAQRKRLEKWLRGGKR